MPTYLARLSSATSAAKKTSTFSQRNVSVSGKIGIIKLGNASPFVREKNLSIFRALSVANAERAGMIGVVLYTDPGNDGPMTEGNGYRPFPDGPARPLKAIEREGLEILVSKWPFLLHTSIDRSKLLTSAITRGLQQGATYPQSSAYPCPRPVQSAS